MLCSASEQLYSVVVFKLLNCPTNSISRDSWWLYPEHSRVTQLVISHGCSEVIQGQFKDGKNSYFLLVLQLERSTSFKDPRNILNSSMLIRFWILCFCLFSFNIISTWCNLCLKSCKFDFYVSKKKSCCCWDGVLECLSLSCTWAWRDSSVTAQSQDWINVLQKASLPSWSLLGSPSVDVTTDPTSLELVFGCLFITLSMLTYSSIFELCSSQTFSHQGSLNRHKFVMDI